VLDFVLYLCIKNEEADYSFLVIPFFILFCLNFYLSPPLMHIHQRINARKLLLSYIYHYCFLAKLTSSVEIAAQATPTFSLSEQQDPFFDQHFLADLKTLWEYNATEGERFQASLTTLLTEDAEEGLPYYLNHFFDQRKEEEVDMEYLFQVGRGFSHYVQEIQDIVNTYTETFTYQQMDVIDQAIFLLGYSEYQLLHTPKEILINEMVELAKRYSDEGAPKLINGIMHKIIANSN
jgi:N utilization substance protein B